MFLGVAVTLAGQAALEHREDRDAEAHFLDSIRSEATSGVLRTAHGRPSGQASGNGS